MKPEATEQYAKEHPNEDVEVVAGNGWRKNEDDTYSCTIKGCKQPNGYRPGGFKSYQAVRMHQTRSHEGKGNNVPPKAKIKIKPPPNRSRTQEIIEEGQQKALQHLKLREVLRQGDGKSPAGPIDDIKDLVNGKTEAPDWSHENESGGVVSSPVMNRDDLIRQIYDILRWRNAGPFMEERRRQQVEAIIDLVMTADQPVAVLREAQQPGSVSIKVRDGRVLVEGIDGEWDEWSIPEILGGIRMAILATTKHQVSPAEYEWRSMAAHRLRGPIER